ncbi:hypothetical protein SDC9_40199 [bioreactor metagenome]|uniref:Uncharacterized protein n=1 Tax=bioreactor metagenome TaxID=1076179 RepID=A0A644VRM1_9ZZZZ
MAPQSIEALRNKETRGCIMRALALSRFRAISSHTLQMALVEKDTDIMPQLYYLADKAYITVVDVKQDNLTGIDYLINLTAHGIDLIEGNIPADPGVAI